MANFRRTQSQNRLAEGRVCFVVRAGQAVTNREMDWGGMGDVRLTDIASLAVVNRPRAIRAIIGLSSPNPQARIVFVQIIWPRPNILVP